MKICRNEIAILCETFGHKRSSNHLLQILGIVLESPVAAEMTLNTFVLSSSVY